MGGIKLRTITGESAILQPEDTALFHESGSIDLQDISIEAIQDKSKVSWFEKLVASCQITWFLAQLVARAVSQLSTSPLEYFTLAYVVCALAMYVAWWHKPYDLQKPFMVSLRSPLPYKYVVYETAHTKVTVWSRHGPFFPDWGYQETASDPGESVGPHYRTAFFSSLIVFGILFGFCHLLVWHSPFVTSTEVWLWRVASICSVALPILVVVLQHLWLYLDVSTGPLAGNFFKSIVFTLCLMYVVMRLFLLFEVFFAFRSVSPSTYVAIPWVQYVPHI